MVQAPVAISEEGRMGTWPFGSKNDWEPQPVRSSRDARSVAQMAGPTGDMRFSLDLREEISVKVAEKVDRQKRGEAGATLDVYEYHIT
jgi:hypothetical protein